MKHFTNLFLAFVLAMSPAHGAVILTDDIGNKLFDKLRFPNSQATRVADKSYRVETGNRNMLVNPSFEDATLLAGWTSPSSPGTKDISVETSRVWDGDKALKVTMTGASSYLLQSVSSAKDFSGTNIEVGIRIATTITGAKLCGRKDGVEIQCADVRNDNVLRYYYVFMPGNSTSTAYDIYVTFPTSTGSLYFDDAYLGPEKSLVAGTSPNTFTAQIASNGAVSSENIDFINGNCSYSSPYYTCTYVSSKFNQRPNCEIQMTTGSGSYYAPFVNLGGSSSTQLQYGFRDSSGNPVQVTHDITCTKTGSDEAKPAITPDQTDKPYTSFTPVLSTGALATGGNQKYWYMLDGPNMIMYFEYEPGANTGTAGSGTYYITVPGGYSISPTITSATGNAANFGFVYFIKSTSNGDARSAQLTLGSSTQLGIRILNPTTDTYETWNNTTAPLSTANMRIGFIATIPIAGRENIRSSNTPLLLNTVYADTAIKAEKAAGLTSVDYGTYSATATNVTNATSITSPIPCSYFRIGSKVDVTCRTSTGCTTASGTNTKLDITLPIATTQTTTIIGTLGAAISGESGRVLDNGSNLARMDFFCQTTSPVTRPINFTYQVP